MAVRVTTIGEFRKLVRQANSKVIKGHSIALIEVAQDARKLSIQLAKAQFKGNPSIGRKLTGQLFKSIKVSFEVSNVQLPKAFLTVGGIPYGAIHEYGGVIKPLNKDKSLWVKIDYKTPYRRMTPSEFMDAKGFRIKAGSSGTKTWSIFKSKKGNVVAAEIKTFKTVKPAIRPLFVLKKEVTIPERPYLRPALKAAGEWLPALSVKRIREQFNNNR